MRVPQVGEQFGRYRLDRLLGQGGMGVVFAATDLRLHRTVAVKVITGALAESVEFRARFQAEAEALARLDSPHVIAIYDHDEIDGTPYIATQFVDGTDLWQLLLERGPLPARQALTLCAQLARGLADAHRAGVVHRDVKPGNVLLREGGSADQHAYLCDFGIARSEGIDGPAPTATGMVAGTWSYLAPERTVGAPATASSDIYALGCVLWACLTGREPFQGTEVQVALAHQQAPIPRLPGEGTFTEQLNQVVERALAKDPAERYADAATLRADLERLAAVAPTDTLAGPPGDPAAPTAARPAQPATVVRGGGSRRPRRRLLAAAGAALAVVLVAAGLTWAIAGRDDEDCCAPSPTAAADPVTGDLDGDGLGDVLVRQRRQEGLTPIALWTIGSTGKRFGAPVEDEAREEARLLQGDVDGDGSADQIWLDGLGLVTDAEVTVTVVPGGGGDVVEQAIPVDPGLFTLPSAVVAEVTGDGRDDLVVYDVDPATGRTSIFVAASDGEHFEELGEWYAAEEGGQGDWVVPGDFDGDGADELLEVRLGESVADYDVRVLTPEGEGFTAAPERRLTGSTLGVSAWLPLDVDGDGGAELVVPGARGESIFFYDVTDGRIGDRQISWTGTVDEERYLENVSALGQGTWTFADVDGDEDDDLVHADLLGDDEQSIALRVFLAEDGAFQGPTPWGELPCAPVCDDDFELIGPTALTH